MGFFQWLFSLFQSEPEPQPEPLEQSDEPISRERDGDEIIEVSIHSTKRLYERNGRISEQMLARQLAHAFDRTGYGYNISYNHDLVDVSSEQSVCGDSSALHEWKEMDDLHVAKDSNVLMTDANGGGCGFVGGDTCTAPGRNIDRLVFTEKRGSGDRLYRNLSGNMHEIGHNLGLGHDMDDDTEGKQHTGRGWNDAHNWHRTPMCVANGVNNLCGEHIPTRQHDDVVSELYYHDCSVENFDIE